MYKFAFAHTHTHRAMANVRRLVGMLCLHLTHFIFVFSSFTGRRRHRSLQPHISIAFQMEKAHTQFVFSFLCFLFCTHFKCIFLTYLLWACHLLQHFRVACGCGCYFFNSSLPFLGDVWQQRISKEIN